MCLRTPMEMIMEWGFHVTYENKIIIIMKNRKCLLGVLALLFMGITVSAQHKKTDREMFQEGYVLKPAEIRVAPLTEKYKPTTPRLYSIENRGKETVVTFIQPIYFDSQWVTFGYGFQLVDKKKGDIYKVRGYDNGLPMDRLLIVKGCNRKNILVSLVFPRLKRKVKTIDILDVWHEKDLIPSNDDGVRRCIYNVSVKDYLNKKQKRGNIYY